MALGRSFNTLMAFQFVRELTKDWEDMKAYELGIIDDEGNVLKKQRELETKEEKDAYTFFHRLIWNLKRLLDKTPGGRSKIKNYAAAMALLKENEELIKKNFKRQYIESEEYNEAVMMFESVVNVTGGVAKVDPPLFGKKKKKKDDDEDEEMPDKKFNLKAKIKEAEEAIEEKKIKRVIRGGKKVKKITCPDGQQVKNGKCVPIKSADKLRFVKAAKKRKRSLAGKSTAGATRKRKKSDRKRRSSGL